MREKLQFQIHMSIEPITALRRLCRRPSAVSTPPLVIAQLVVQAEANTVIVLGVLSRQLELQRPQGDESFGP